MAKTKSEDHQDEELEEESSPEEDMELDDEDE